MGTKIVRRTNDYVIGDVILSKQKIISVPGGNVFHGISSEAVGYAGFGEAYFSSIEHGAVKGWKRHRDMTLNLLVPVGVIRFIIYDDREFSPTQGYFQEVELCQENYYRLTIPPMLWMAFQGISDETALVLNVANIPHNAEEVDRKNLSEIEFSW